MKKRILSLILSLAVAAVPLSVAADGAKRPKYSSCARQTERLGRGLIAVRTYDAPRNGIEGGVYLSWRLLGDESLENQAFDIYRNGSKIHTTAAHAPTCFTDRSGTENDVYKVVRQGESPVGEKGVKAFKEHNKTARGSLAGSTSEKNSFTYIDIPIVRPDNVKNYGGGTSKYHTDGSNNAGGANDASVGDLDGDGEYELVLKWNPSDAKDSASGGYTGSVYIDAYEINESNGGYMWRIDLGKNIRAGAHYTQFMVYDLDGDGKSEIAMKTAPGSIDGTGRYVTEVGDSAEIRNADNSAVYLSGKGIPNAGGEYLTVFDGETGRALCTTDYIPRGNVSDWGDSNYNRSERYLAAIAYLDGAHPSLIMCRGYYARSVVRAYDWDGGALRLRWEHIGAKKSADSLYGQGNHNLSVADIDNDGRDEIVYGSAAIDDDGRIIGNTLLGHGDAMHVSDFNNDGVQEVFSVKEASYKTDAANFRVAATGETLFSLPGGGDCGRGVMANIDDSYAASHPNALALGWSVADEYAHDLTGAAEGAKPTANSRTMTNFLVYWDGDLGRELLDDTLIAKYHADTGRTVRFYNDGSAYSLPASSNNDSKMTPSLVADLWGDWREEIIMPVGRGEGETPYLRIFTSTLPTEYRLTTLMHDSQYRMAVAWQNVAYNQPPHQSYYIGTAALAADLSGNKLNYLAPETAFTTVKYAENIPVAGLEVSETKITVKQGSAHTLTASVMPENATRKGVSWSSDDESVARVIGGRVEGLSPGVCIVRAVTNDGGLEKTCSVTVLPVKTFDITGENSFSSPNTDAHTSFDGGVDYARLTQEDSAVGGEFIRSFMPLHADKAELSFEFNTGGRKNSSGEWNWDGREYSFSLDFLDEDGKSLLAITQGYRTKAQKTAAVFGGSAENVESAWTQSGSTDENPLNRSSATWYVSILFDYDADCMTAKITGSKRDIEYSKSYPLGGKSFAALSYRSAVEGNGAISVSPSLSKLQYTVTKAADSEISLVGAADRSVTYYASAGGEAALAVAAIYNPDGSLCEVKTAAHEAPAAETASFEFASPVLGKRLRLFLLKDKETFAPLAPGFDSGGALEKIDIASAEASDSPEASHPPENAFDGNIYTVWASKGKQNIIFDLGGEKTVTAVRVAFKEYEDERTIPFRVYTSTDKAEWNMVFSGNSVPQSGKFIDVGTAVRAAFVKLEVDGSSVSEWTSLAEAEIIGISK